jgi:hypothetical protein
MTNVFLTCEGCHGRKPFLMHEQELADARGGKPIQKHCPACRTVTHWMLTDERRADDRRAVTDRSQAPDRRTPSS